MREAAESRYVARTVDIRTGLQGRRVHLQPSPLGLGDASCAPGFEVRPPAGGDEQPVRFHDRAGLEADHHAGAVSFHGHARIADDQRDAVCLQVRPKRRARLGLFQTEKSRSGFDHSDLRAEPRVGLAELDANRAAPQHRQPGGQLARQGGLAVRPVRDRVQAWDGWDGCRAAVGDDQRAARDQLFATHLDGAQVHQRPCTAEQLRAGRLERCRRPGVVQVPGHPQDPFGDLWEVDFPLHPRGGQSAGALCFFECFTGAQQGLGGDASPVGALPAHELALDQCHGKTAALKTDRDRLSGDAAAKAHDVKFLRQPAHLPECPRAGVIPTRKSR